MTLQPLRKTEKEILTYIATLVMAQNAQPCRAEDIRDFWLTARGLAVATTQTNYLIVGHGVDIMRMWEDRIP